MNANASPYSVSSHMSTMPRNMNSQRYPRSTENFPHIPWDPAIKKEFREIQDTLQEIDKIVDDFLLELDNQRPQQPISENYATQKCQAPSTTKWQQWGGGFQFQQQQQQQQSGGGFQFQFQQQSGGGFQQQQQQQQSGGGLQQQQQQQSGGGFQQQQQQQQQGGGGRQGRDATATATATATSSYGGKATADAKACGGTSTATSTATYGGKATAGATSYGGEATASASSSPAPTKSGMPQYINYQESPTPSGVQNMNREIQTALQEVDRAVGKALMKLQ